MDPIERRKHAALHQLILLKHEKVIYCVSAAMMLFSDVDLILGYSVSLILAGKEEED